MKHNRGKQNIQSSTNQPQYVSSTYRVESDQKDVIIKALRGDHQLLKKNQGQYYKLHEQYKQLQHRYKLLNDQKANDDRDFKMKHEAAIRSIGQLRSEIDSLRAEIRDKKLEITDLQGDGTALKQQLDEKSIELQNQKNDLRGCIADSEELTVEREGLNNAVTKLKGIVGQVHDQGRHLKQDNDSVSRRLDQLQSYQQQLVLQERILREKIQGFENENNQLDGHINHLCDDLAELELSIKRAQEELADLQQAVSEIGLLNDKYRTEAQLAQKSTQAETLRNNSLAKDLKTAEYTQRVRAGQVEEAGREIQGLRGEREELGRINGKLSEDLEACLAHLQNLGLINNKLVDHLQNFSNEDEGVRDLINRKSRVDASRGRVSDVQNTSYGLSGERYSGETRFGSNRREYR